MNLFFKSTMKILYITISLLMFSKRYKGTFGMKYIVTQREARCNVYAVWSSFNVSYKKLFELDLLMRFLYRK